jgi:hypothetical protein
MQESVVIHISAPIVRSGKMFLSLHVAEVSKEANFFYPLNDVDNKLLMLHIMWKFSGDPNYAMKALAQVVDSSNMQNVKLKNWEFLK